jgi:hypothetical protein
LPPQLSIERHEDGDRLIQVRLTWDSRPGRLLRVIFNLAVGPLCLWLAIHAGFGKGPYLLELAGRALIGAMGLLLPYIALVELLNTTTVTLNAAGLSIWHGPIPWGRRKGHLPLAALTVARSVFVGSEEPTYSVCVVTELKEATAFSGLSLKRDAESIAAVLNEAIDRLQHAAHT